MHPLLLTADFLGLTLGDVIVHPKIGLSAGTLFKATLHQLLTCRIVDSLITTGVAAILTLSGVMVVVIPAIGFVLSKREALIKVDLVGRFISAANNQSTSKGHQNHHAQG